MTGDLYADRVETLSRATIRLSFDPLVDIDWDAPENALDGNDPRWQLGPDTAPLAATDWYAGQPSKQRLTWAAGSPRIRSRWGFSSR